MVGYCPKCGNKIDGKPDICPECKSTLPTEVTSSENSFVNKSKLHNTRHLGTGYLIGCLMSIFMGIFCQFNRESFVLLFMPYYDSSSLSLAEAVTKHSSYISSSISILVIWSIMLIVPFFMIYYKKRYGRIIGVIVCIVGIISSFYLYWGGFGLFYLALFAILLIVTIINWKKLEI